MAVGNYFRSLLPSYRVQDDLPAQVEAKPIDIDIEKFTKAPMRLFKSKALALPSNTGFLGRRGSFECPPYDFDQILKACETDSYVLQSFNKYKELLWKEGWDIVGENPAAIDYLYERINHMEFVMRRPFSELLTDIGEQLVRFNNAFLVKSRSADMGRYVSAVLDGDDPIAGYYLIPAETVEIKRNKFNKPLEYRQRINGLVGDFYASSPTEGSDAPVWQARDVIHFAMGKRPGVAFGTPFIYPVLDDVIALRQLEEDIQNLVHKELFPLYKYMVGSEIAPASEEEISNAIRELENLRNDGGLVLPERHDVEVVGANNTALDASEYLRYFVGRVVSGLGLSPHHLGLMLDSAGNRAVTDRLDISLYDKVKSYQRYLSDMIRLHIFSELLIEGGFNPLVHPHAPGASDYCEFKFREVDIDTLIKKENHAVNKFAQNGIDQGELRMSLGMKPDLNDGEDRLQAAVMARHTAQPVTTPDGGSGGPTKSRAPVKASAPPKNTRKGPGNISQPANQYGKRLSPNVRHAIEVDEEWLDSVVGLIDNEE